MRHSIEKIIFVLDNIDKGTLYISNKINLNKRQIIRLLLNLKRYDENEYYKKIVIENNLQFKINNIPIKKDGICLISIDEDKRKEKISSTMKNNKKSGGIRKGSGVGKKGRYSGYWCDSSYELVWVIYNIEHDIKFERNNKKFPYQYKNETHHYIPDFICNDVFIEIKGYIDEKMEYKIDNFPHELKILMLNDLKIEMNYVVSKYGKNFIELYDERNFNLKYCKCGNVLCKTNKFGVCKECLNKKELKEKRKKDKNIYCCEKCGVKIRKNKTGFCKKCYERPKKLNISKEELEKLINVYPNTKIAEMLSVSDITIKKKLIGFNLVNRVDWQKLKSEELKKNKIYCECGNEIKKKKSKSCAYCSRRKNLKQFRNK